MRKIPSRSKYQAAESSDQVVLKKTNKQKTQARSVRLLYTQVSFKVGASNFLGSLRFYSNGGSCSECVFSRTSWPDKRKRCLCSVSTSRHHPSRRRRRCCLLPTRSRARERARPERAGVPGAGRGRSAASGKF